MIAFRNLGRWLLLTAALLWAAPALAQRAVPPDALLEQATDVARDVLPLARLEDGSKVPQETPEERARPLIPRALEVQTFQRGELSAWMQACGLDWARLSFAPYMRTLRASGRYGSKQIAYIAVLHGTVQGLAEQAIEETGVPCPPDRPEALREEAARTVIETP